MIRTEQPEDYAAVYALVKDAFASAEQADGTEQDLVVALRKSDAFRPELSLVAEENGAIVGHILFTEGTVGETTVLALAPLAVRPDRQGKGIGKALIQQGHQVAKALGYSIIVVLGSDAYYPKSGYFPASRLGIQAPFPVPDQNFMAISLSAKPPVLQGVLQYAKEFGITP